MSALAGPSLVRTNSVDRNRLVNKLRSTHDQPSDPAQPQPQPQPPVPLHNPPTPIADVHDVEFSEPRKRIVSQRHLERFEHSQAFSEILGLVQYCNESVVGKSLTKDAIEESDSVRAILDIISHVSEMVKQTPPDAESKSRFGNPAFRSLYDKIRDRSRELHSRIPGLQDLKGKGKAKEGSIDAIGEIEVYFIECWGNQKRIDYGSGMELNFVCWL